MTSRMTTNGPGRRTIGIIGEPIEGSRSQALMLQALGFLQSSYSFDIAWVPTDDIERQGRALLERFSGFWSAPGGSFNSLQGALQAIQYAREENVPHVATCGGFHHTVLELARHVFGLEKAQHEERDPEGSCLVVTQLGCNLRGQTATVLFKKNTLARSLYRKPSEQEEFACRYGINPKYRDLFETAPLSVSGIDENGEIRILEIPSHRFFMATLFIPQARSTASQPHPILKKFVEVSTCAST